MLNRTSTVSWAGIIPVAFPGYYVIDTKFKSKKNPRNNDHYTSRTSSLPVFTLKNNLSEIFLMRLRIGLLIVMTCCFSCSDSDNALRTRVLDITIAHVINNEPIQFHQLIYENAAHNVYEVTSIQWFISDAYIIDDQGMKYPLLNTEYHYIDTIDPNTIHLQTNDLPMRTYTSIQFVFGLSDQHNRAGRFQSPPESGMAWPYAMGGEFGGYHYMKLNGFWLAANEQRMPYNIHLGVTKSGNELDVTYDQHWFVVSLPLNIKISSDKPSKATLTMHVDSWFDTPHQYDHNEFGSAIMTNALAQRMLRENGRDAFSIATNHDE